MTYNVTKTRKDKGVPKKKYVTKKSAGRRARRLFEIPEGQLCVRCYKRPAVDRHHIDGNPYNNVKSNIALLCRLCHLKEDGRLEKMWAGRRTFDTIWEERHS